MVQGTGFIGVFLGFSVGDLVEGVRELVLGF